MVVAPYGRKHTGMLQLSVVDVFRTAARVAGVRYTIL